MNFKVNYPFNEGLSLHIQFILFVISITAVIAGRCMHHKAFDMPLTEQMGLISPKSLRQTLVEFPFTEWQLENKKTCHFTGMRKVVTSRGSMGFFFEWLQGRNPGMG